MKQSQRQQLQRLRNNLSALALSVRYDEEPPSPDMQYDCDCDRRALSRILRVESNLIDDLEDDPKTYRRYFK